MLRRIAAVEATKVPRGKKRYQKSADAERDDVARILQFKVADTADEHVADDDIEKESPCPGGLANGL
jgi:hypothetical protein